MNNDAIWALRMMCPVRPANERGKTFEVKPRAGYPQALEPPYESSFEAELAHYGIKLDCDQLDRYRSFIRDNPMGGSHHIGAGKLKK